MRDANQKTEAIKTEPIGDKARQEASRWVALLRSEVADAEVEARFDEWLRASPEHAAAYESVESLWSELDQVPAFGQIDVDAAIARVNESESSVMRKSRDFARRPAYVPAALAAGLAVAVLGAAFYFSSLSGFDTYMPAYTTEIAEIREITLEDGSVVTLGARSKIETAFTPGSREVVLTAGEAFFSIAKDPMRPFFVKTDEAVIRVVGTEFDVKRGINTVRVSVLEGIVEVMRADDLGADITPAAVEAAPKQVLTAGEMVVATAAAPTLTITSVEPDVPGAWRSGRLIYENARLAEVIADANRYYEPPILIVSNDLGDIRVTTAFGTGQIDEMLSALEYTQPVVVDRSQPDRVLLRPAEQ